MKPMSPRDRALVAAVLALGGLIFAILSYILFDIPVVVAALGGIFFGAFLAVFGLPRLRK